MVMTLCRDDARRSMRLIVDDRRPPTLALVDRPLFPLRIVFDLIAFDFSHAEICALRMAEVEAADRCTRPHREALRQSYADTLAVEQPEQHALLGVVGLRRIAGRGTDSAILLRDQLLIAQVLIGGIAPELPAHALMQTFGKRFRQAIGQCFPHVRRIIVIGAFEPLRTFVFADAGGEGEAADIILETAAPWRDEIAERGIWPALALGQLLPKRMQNRRRLAARVVSLKADVVPPPIPRPATAHLP